MGFFIDKQGDVRPSRIAGAVFGGALSLLTAWKSYYVNDVKEASVIVAFGQIVDVTTQPGFYLKRPWIDARNAYSLARQITEIGQTNSVRTSDDVRLTAPYSIEWEIDETADVQALYSQLAGSGRDIASVVDIRARDAATQVFEGLTVADLAEPGFTERVKGEIMQKLQASLTEGGWPVRVLSISSDGFTLSPGSEEILEEIISIRQERLRLQLRAENAEKAEAVFAAEAKADMAYLSTLRELGVPEGQLLCALHYKMIRDAGKIGQPFAPVCGSGGEVGAGASVVLNNEVLDRLLAGASVAEIRATPGGHEPSAE